MPESEKHQKDLSLLSIVPPARDEEGYIAATIEHLHLELKLQNVTHEILLVEGGSTDSTWNILSELKEKVLTLNLMICPEFCEHGILDNSAMCLVA
jgi:dolichol-phosphate mannosyltransferase